MADSRESNVRTQSPELNGGSDRKRRRKVLSCYDCRRRKLQCDRAMPACSRCTKAGQATNCLYIDDVNETPPSRHPDSAAHANAEFSSGPLQGHYSRPIQTQPQSQTTTGDPLTRLEYQDRRIKQLEAALAQSTQSQTSSAVQQLKIPKLPHAPESVAAPDNTAATTVHDRETMLLRGKSFKTQFHGTTHPGSLIAYLPELNVFTRETFENFPGLARIRQDLHALEDRTDYAGSLPQSTSDADMRAMLPPRIEADDLVQLYLDNYDSLYHILHVPSFRQEYNEMWNDLQNARTHFVVLVLLMIASAQCLTSAEPWLYTAGSSTAREKAIHTMQLSEDWLRTQSEKHVTIVDFQIRFLLLFGKIVNARKFKRVWTESGNFLRFCMAAGMHRNPELLRKPTSALDKELRRRMWAAASEWELHQSFNRGMIPSPWPYQSDCPPPSNIHDHDVDQSSEEMPTARPISEFTNSAYLVAASQTVMLRHTLTTALNNIRQTISFDDAKRYTDQVEAHLRSLPHWIGSTSETPQALLSLNLRHYLLVLHERQVRQGSQTERNFSRMAILDNAMKIMDTHKTLVNNGNNALLLLCQDEIRAALSVCHVAGTLDPKADALISQVVEQHASAVVSDAIDHISHKVTRWGREQRQMWITVAANGFMKSKKDPSQKMVYMQEAIDRVTRPYYKIMACQEDAPTAVSSGPPTGNREEMPNGMIEYLPNVEQSKASEFEAADPTLLSFDDIAAWTFEDWQFNPADFQNFDGVY